MNRDQDHLRLLGLFHYVHAALIACTTSFGVVYLGFVAAMMPMMSAEIEAQAKRQRAAAQQAEAAAQKQDETSESVAQPEEANRAPIGTPSSPPAPTPTPVGGGPPEAFFSMISSLMYGMGATMLLFGCLMAFANVYAARCIARRKHRTICLLTAGFNCLNTPLGLILGISSFLVLLRPSVEDLFAGRGPADAAISDAEIID